MTEQLDLEDFGRRLSVYRDTSREAWESFLPVSAELDRAIMGALDAAKHGGLTCEEIEKLLDRKHQAVAGNLSHLVNKHGLVKATKMRGLTSSGRKAIKWVALRWFNEALHG